MPLRFSRDAYRVGWICPLEVEFSAAMLMLDEQHENLPQLPGDKNPYTLGSINSQNIVIVCLPRAGNRYAVSVVTQMRMTFPSLKYALLVGIGGGVPVKTEHGFIRLGHVVVSKPTGIHSGAVQYDHGKSKKGHFERTGCLESPPSELLSAATVLVGQRVRLDHDPVWANLKRTQTNRRNIRQFGFPGAAKDHLYKPDHEHQREGVLCEECGCQPQERIVREIDEEEEESVVVHRGTIATGERVMKNAKLRDKLAEQHNVLCFETEAAGALTDFPCMVIRGISDYCDSHKNDVWQGYAAATAAAYARQLFFHMPTEEIKWSRIESEFSRQRSTSQSPKIEVINKRDHRSRSYILPPFKNRHFTGRETTLEELQWRLFIQADTPELALFGLGGIGKTQVALQLAEWVKKQRPEFSIFWAPALSLQTFEQACSRIVKEVGIQQHSDDECESAMQLVHDHLSSDAAGKWLFIVDNADDRELLFNELVQYFPDREKGVTLLTTRTLEVAVAFAQTDIVELGKMTETEGTDFLEKIVKKDLLCGPESTTQLLKELHFLPLAIVQAASYMSNLGLKVSKYLEIMHNTEKDRADLASRDFFDRTRYPLMPNDITTTWIISFKQIRKIDPAAAELLGFLSYIEPKEIPQSMLPTIECKERTAFAIGILCSYAFLTRSDDENLYDMHGLVQMATRRWVEKDDRVQQVIQNVIQRMDECFPSYENYSLENCRAYLPHALKIIRRDESRGISERYSLLIKVGDFVYSEGRKKEALSFFEDASIWHESQHDEENRQFSEHALANAYRSSNQIERAVQILERVVTARKSTANKEDRSLLAYQYALAMAYKSGHQIKPAVKILEDVVKIQKDALDKKDRDLLSSQHALANAYRSDGQIKRAVRILEHVVTIQKDTLNEDDRDLLSSQQALAKACRSDGQIERAVEILKDVDMIRERTKLIEEESNRLSSQLALAKAYKSDGKIDLAIQIFELVVSVREETLDKEDSSLLRSQRALAKAYKSVGLIDLAVQILEHVVKMQEGISDEDYDKLSSQHELAIAYRSKRQCEPAVRILEHVIAVQERTLSEEHPHLLSSQHALGKSYCLNKQTDKAVKILEHVVMVRKKTLDTGHFDLLASEKSLAKAKKKAEVKNKAETKKKPKAREKSRKFEAT